MENFLLKMKLWPQKFSHEIPLSDIAVSFFQSWKKYIARMDYNLDDYYRRTIPHTFQTFLPSITIVLAATITIVYLIILVAFPATATIIFPFTLNDLEKVAVNPKNYRPLKDVHLNCVTIHANPFADPNVAQ